MKKYFSILVMAIFLPLGSVAASDQEAAYQGMNKSEPTGSSIFIGDWQTTVTRNRTIDKSWNRPRSVGKRVSKIAALRAEALQISMKHLPRLRPYASNYPRMVSVVRAYWRKNAANPSASRLTNVIMRHVQAKYRFLVRPKLRAGISKGINVLKRKLHKS